MTTKKKIVVFSIFTLSFAAVAAAAAAAAILDIFSQSSSFWKKKKKKKKKTIQLKPNPGGGGGGGGGSTSTLPSSGPDRISELPVEILHHILGFLDMDELLIQTSLVSTKWRYLWKSVPTLKFPNSTNSRIRRRTDDDDDDDSVVVDNGGGGAIRNNVEKYHIFVDHVLRLRDSQASKIQIFNYSCVSRLRGYDYSECLHNFIVNAVVNQGAQEIQVKGFHVEKKINNNNMIHFDPSIFTSGLLRKFKLHVNRGHSLIQFPRSMCCATQLTHLSLNGIILPQGDDSNAQLHLVCPVLETLVMISCVSEHLKVLDISAPRLDTLSISNTSIRFGGSDFLGGCRIEIRTPNLTSLDYSGYVYVDCFMENLPRIANARLDFGMLPGIMEETTLFAIKLLKGLTSAQTLTLGGFEVFSEDLFKELLTPFTSLRTLIITSCKTSSIHGMVHFLKSCSSVDLFWRWNEIRTVESDEHLMLPHCRLSRLKHVHIARLHGHKNEIDL